MKKLLKYLFIVVSIGSLYFVPWSLLIDRFTPLPNTVQEQVNQAESYGFDGIIVYIDKNGNAPITYTSGYKNRATQTPADVNSLFKIASVSKLYTAFCITRLAYNQQLDLEQTIDYYFPELAGKIAYMDQITVKNLVQHRSGIPDYTRINEYWSHPKTNDDERLAIVFNEDAHFEPDTDYEYSNTNYLLLSRIIEQVTQGTKFEFISSEILKPLDLENTFCSISDVDMENVMSGYYVGYEEDLKYDDNDAMLATAADLAAFIRALNDGSLFKNEKERKLYHSLYELEHTGLIPGYQTIATYDRELDLVLIQFMNTTDFDGYHWSYSELMANRILTIIKNSD